MQIRFTNFLRGAVMTSPSRETPPRIEIRDQIMNLGNNEYRFTDTLSIIDGPWLVGYMRSQYFIYVYYKHFLMLCCSVPILDIRVVQTEPERLFRIQVD